MACAFGVAREGAADDEAVLRAGERDIEQAAMFAQGAGFGDRRGVRAEVGVVAPSAPGQIGAPSSVMKRPSRSPRWAEQVSGRMTMGASRPLAPWTVITRTSSCGPESSRFTSPPRRSTASRKSLQAGRLVGVEAGGAIDEGGDRLARGAAEAGEDQLPAGAGEAWPRSSAWVRNS